MSYSHGIYHIILKLINRNLEKSMKLFGVQVEFLSLLLQNVLFIRALISCHLILTKKLWNNPNLIWKTIEDIDSMGKTITGSLLNNICLYHLVIWHLLSKRKLRTNVLHKKEIFLMLNLITTSLTKRLFSSILTSLPKTLKLYNMSWRIWKILIFSILIY